MRRALSFLGLLLCVPVMSQIQTSPSCQAGLAEITAAAVVRPITLDAAHPAPEWHSATPVAFCQDWQGNHPDPQRETQVQALWSADTLYLRFQCRYRDISVFPDSDANGRRDHLWDRDVAEAFLQPEPSQPRAYKEFEVSPNGFWIDLDISPGANVDLKSGLQRSVFLDEKANIWTAVLALPMKALTQKFDPAKTWRVNFYRVEGKQEPRGYYAWQPTKTMQPNFHVPEAFGQMRFAPSR